MQNKLYLYDSVQKEKVLFQSQEENKVKIYVCGPTVYDDAHLGHARSAIVFDILHRVLIANGYDVTMVKNFTDVDDKIVKKMEATGQSLEEITSLYIDSYQSDMNALNILQNTIEPKATESIEAMDNLIETLIKKDVAYVINDGVYFDTSKDIKYGSISKKVADDNTQARVDGNKNKKNQKDFALWKFNTNSVSFESHEGKGRPGWHCECSAMIEKHLSNHSLEFAVDIHGGGADLLFPHHENEAAQSRMAYGQELSKYWMHNGFVNIDGQKMSKSLGNSFFLKDVLKEYDGEVIRFYTLTSHYRSDLSFNTQDLESSKKRLDKLYRLKKRIYGASSNNKETQFQKDVLNALNDDFNTSIALSLIDEMLVSVNEKLDTNPKDKNLKKETISNLEFLGKVLGICLKDAYSYFQFGISEKEKKKIEALILQRTEAKKAKNFELSDTIRNELTNMKINIMDTVNGTMWEKV